MSNRRKVITLAAAGLAILAVGFVVGFDLRPLLFRQVTSLHIRGTRPEGCSGMLFHSSRLIVMSESIDGDYKLKCDQSGEIDENVFAFCDCE